MFMNLGLFYKSWMLEFSSGFDSDIFTFSVPAQSEDISYPQRVNETKTFTGNIIDDYGNDTATITLSGSTINNDLKFIYRGLTSLPALKNGKGEVYMLKKIIEKYGELDALKKDKKIKLYCLMSPGYKSFEVAIKSFDIKRSKENPMAYNYTLQMIAWPYNFWKLPDLDSIMSIVGFIASNPIQQLKNTIVKLVDTFVDLCELGVSSYYSLKDSISEFYNILGILEPKFERLSDDKEKNDDEFTEQYGVENANRELWKKIENVSDDVVNYSRLLVEKTNEIKDFFDNLKVEDITSAMEIQYNASKEEILDSFKKTSSEFATTVNSLYVSTLKNVNDSSYAVVPNYTYNPYQQDKNDELVKIYGSKTVTIKEGDTWDNLSVSHYGTAKYSMMLQLFNNTDLVAGSEIKIPNLKLIGNFELNSVMTTESDNFGKDIGITDDGDIDIDSNGDLGISKGIQTLNQAIIHRLTTSISSRIRNIAYGIRSTVGGDNTAIKAILINDIKSTLAAEPRITSVDDITFKGEGSAIYVNIDYTDINGTKRKFQGEI